MKKSVFTSFLGLFMSLLLLATTSLAWLSMNKDVASSGMEMTIDTIGCLVISDNADTLASYTSASFADSYIRKSWAANAIALIPTDHYNSSTYPTVTGTNTKGLVYNTNPLNVSRSTGKGSDLTFAHVPSDGNNKYYIDYTVYIASLDKAFTKGTDYNNIKFTISEDDAANGTGRNRAYKSASVDVYVAGAYKGTLNLDTLTNFSIGDVASIPVNAGDGSGNIEILFRCYFNGALQDANDASKNYVNSAALSTNTANIFFTVTITAE